MQRPRKAGARITLTRPNMRISPAVRRGTVQLPRASMMLAVTPEITSELLTMTVLRLDRRGAAQSAQLTSVESVSRQGTHWHGGREQT